MGFGFPGAVGGRAPEPGQNSAPIPQGRRGQRSPRPRPSRCSRRRSPRPAELRVNSARLQGLDAPGPWRRSGAGGSAREGAAAASP